MHLFADERALGEHYNTVEALLQQESLAKFAAFQNKQKARKGGHVNAQVRQVATVAACAIPRRDEQRLGAYRVRLSMSK